MIKGAKSTTHFIFSGYSNYFAGENNMVCNRRMGIENQSQFGMFLNNEISHNGDTGIILGENSIGNLIKDNKLVCNIPRI